MSWVAPVEQLGRLDRPSYRARAVGPSHSSQVGDIIEKVHHHHLGVERAVLRQIAHAGLGRAAVRLDIETVDQHSPAGGLEIAGQYLHDGRLASAVEHGEMAVGIVVHPDARLDVVMTVAIGRDL